MAGLLVFGVDPQRFLPQGRVTAVRFLGDDIGKERLSPQELTRALPRLVCSAGEYVCQHAGVY